MKTRLDLKSVKEQLYIDITTHKVGTYNDFWYYNDDDDLVNLVEEGEVFECEYDDEKDVFIY